MVYCMDLLEAIKLRRSVRRFKKREVPMDIILKLIDYARYAPSSKNRQPWYFIITRDKDKIVEVSRIKGEDWIAKAPVLIIAISDPKVSPRYHMSDTAMAIHNMSLAALEFGLGTCWIGVYEDESVKQLFGIPEEKVLVGALAVGYPDESPTMRPRKSLGETVFIEQYGVRMD